MSRWGSPSFSRILSAWLQARMQGSTRARHPDPPPSAGSHPRPLAYPGHLASLPAPFLSPPPCPEFVLCAWRVALCCCVQIAREKAEVVEPKKALVDAEVKAADTAAQVGVRCCCRWAASWRVASPPLWEGFGPWAPADDRGHRHVRTSRPPFV